MNNNSASISINSSDNCKFDNSQKLYQLNINKLSVNITNNIINNYSVRYEIDNTLE